MESLRRKGKTIGFVPTMGALHEGHASLIKKARKENDICAVSIFVNPAQFGPQEDFKKYPRPALQDHRLLVKEKVDYLFYPSTTAMYPEGFATYVEAEHDSLSAVLCGKFRPGHFRGVATVVAKLFNLTGPCRTYFGAKDYQQTVVVKRLIDDLDFNIDLRVLPTVREKDGLALSSRNRYLSDEERRRALVVPQTLFWLQDQIQKGNPNLAGLRRQALERLKRAADRVDYLEIVDPDSLASLRRVQPKMVAALACFVGKTRLIDNVIMRMS
jgi:pantoate--beta-alanine ligase